ncbi:MAG: SUMF1/EgtB/PvdO family nonheme iron enzyme [Myxococcales bacterium]|nr:SUMF1/EgtB/PvdO family nonheme iron enzyme [Myxococcales bacterium]
MRMPWTRLSSCGPAARALLAISVVAAGGCGQVEKAPLPEALVVVDTNLPVPLVVGRLRVDLYTEDGTWFESNDFGRADVRDWPVSFSVYSPDEGEGRGIFVRLRAYPEGYVETYEGERVRDWDAPLAQPQATREPRLLRDGVDATPAEAPLPLMTVDRLVFVRLEPGKRGRLPVLLHGACVGTMAHVGPEGRPALGVSTSCVDKEKERSLVAEGALEANMDRPTSSAIGTWLREPCEPDAPDSPTVCIAGGATVLGTVENSDYAASIASMLNTVPVRIFGLHRYYLDRDEVTVARARAAIEAGYTGARPARNDGPVGPRTTRDQDCTFSSTPMGREDYAATCMGWDGARAMCQFFGGDLPTELQWEHAATVAGHAQKRRFPWGNDAPTCERTVVDREPAGGPSGHCAALGRGPRPSSESEGDLSPLGIKRLAGNVSEFVLDEPLPYTADCWLKGPLVNPFCPPPKNADRRPFRGDGFIQLNPRPAYRTQLSTYATLGFRCAYARRPR